MPIPKRAWFGPKRFGWGYGPRTWEGWLVTVAYVVSVVSLRHVISPRTDHSLFIAGIVLLTAAYLGIFIWKFDRNPQS